MPRLYILSGLPASGKSTFAEWFTKNNDIHWVSRDKIRFSIIKDDEEYFSHEKEVFKIFVETIGRALVDGHNVIADATHLNQISRNKLIRAVDTLITNYTIEYIVIQTPFDVCLARNALRSGRTRVPDSVMKNMADNFEDITQAERNECRYRATFHWSGE